jgi:hypothetical protein
MPRTRRTVARKVRQIRLRDHSKVHWPPGIEPNPPWAGPSPEVPEPREVVLTEVHLVEADRNAPRHLMLSGTYHGNVYRTTMMLDDPTLVPNLFRSLEKCVGESIAEAGSHFVDSKLGLL